MKRAAIKISALICFTVLLFSVSAYGVSSPATVSDRSTVADASQTGATEFRLPIDVTDLYTGGVNYDGNQKDNISGKAVFIGVLCMLLVAGIILICVKSRRKDDDDSDNAGSAESAEFDGKDKCSADNGSDEFGSDDDSDK